MKKHLVLYDGTQTFMYPNGEMADPERVYRDFPAARLYPHVIETDEAEQVLFAISNMAASYALYDLELPMEVLDLTDAMQEKRRVEREAEDAQAALDAAQAIAELPAEEIVMGGMDLTRQVRTPMAGATPMQGVETATAVLTEVRQKVRTATDRFEKRCIAVMPALKAMEAVMNAPPEPEVPVTAADRTAAALELLCVLLLPDKGAGDILSPELIDLNYGQGLWGKQAVMLAGSKGIITDAEVKQIVEGVDDGA